MHRAASSNRSPARARRSVRLRGMGGRRLGRWNTRPHGGRRAPERLRRDVRSGGRGARRDRVADARHVATRRRPRPRRRRCRRHRTLLRQPRSTSARWASPRVAAASRCTRSGPVSAPLRPQQAQPGTRLDLEWCLPPTIVSEITVGNLRYELNLELSDGTHHRTRGGGRLARRGLRLRGDVQGQRVRPRCARVRGPDRGDARASAARRSERRHALAPRLTRLRRCCRAGGRRQASRAAGRPGARG